LGAALLNAERTQLESHTKLSNDPIEDSLGNAGREAKRRRHPAQAFAALRLLLLTGCRVGEVLDLRWQHVDLERRLLLLPDSKTGAKTVYLSEPASALLSGLRKDSAGDYVFPGDKLEKPLRSLRKPWQRLCEAAKLNNIRLHDLRHSFASTGVAGGLSLPMIGALLGHSQPTTTARYAHLAASPLHEAADAIGARLLAAMDSHRSEAGGAR